MVGKINGCLFYFVPFTIRMLYPIDDSLPFNRISPL